MSFKMHMGRGIHVIFHVFHMVEGHANQLFCSSSRKEIFSLHNLHNLLRLPKAVFFLACMWLLYMLLVYLYQAVVVDLT